METVRVVAVEGAKATEELGIITEYHKKNRIQVSNTKKPLFFYVNLAKKYIQQHNEVELSALGMAITTVVTIAEILKNNGFAVEKKLLTSTVGMKDEAKGRLVQKAKIEIVLERTEKVDNLITATTNTTSTTPEETEDDNLITTATNTTSTTPEVTEDDNLMTAATNTSSTTPEVTADDNLMTAATITTSTTPEVTADNNLMTAATITTSTTPVEMTTDEKKE